MKILTLILALASAHAMASDYSSEVKRAYVQASRDKSSVIGQIFAVEAQDENVAKPSLAPMADLQLVQLDSYDQPKKQGLVSSVEFLIVKHFRVPQSAYGRRDYSLLVLAEVSTIDNSRPADVKLNVSRIPANCSSFAQCPKISN